jgi:dienelactone hydrolase
MKTIISILFTLIIFNQPTFAEEDIRSYNTYEVTTTVGKNIYEARFYRPIQQKIKAILVISRTLSKSQAVEDSNAKYFAKNGYAVIVPYLFLTELNKPFPDIDQLDSDYYRPVVSAISFINLAEVKLKLPQGLPVLAMGASSGGIVSILLAAYIPRIKAIWVAVAGGDLPHIYAHSDVKQIVKFRQNHMKALGMTDPFRYETYLRSYLKNDPAQSCREIKIPFHQTIALRDTSVPTVNQKLLEKVCPTHKVLRLNLTHAHGILTTVTMRKEIKDFFESAI